MSSTNIYVRVSLSVVCFLFYASAAKVYGICPPKCTCTTVKRTNTTDCTGKGLDHIPEQAEMNSYMHVLRLEGNNIDTLWRIKFPYLREYLVQNNTLKNIKDDAFVDVPHIIILNLTHNSLSSIREQALRPLTSLMMLDLSYNKITTLSAKNFNGSFLQQLHRLDLSHNLIGSIAADAFSMLKSLRTLRLNYNNIKSVKFPVFQTVPMLSALYLDHNKLNHIYDNSFNATTEMTTLTLNDNDLAAIQKMALRNLVDLKDLDLSNNYLGKVPTETFGELRILQTLNLCGNQIVKIDNLAFPTSLGHVTRLSLCNMTTLKEIHDGALDNLHLLVYVNISRNPELSNLEPMLLVQSYHILRELDISHNNLSTVGADMVPWDLLFDVYMAGNKWRCDCHLAWMKKFRFHQDIICSSPPSVAGKKLKTLEPNCFNVHQVAHNNRQEVRTGLAATAVVISILLIAFMTYRFRSQLPCARKARNYNSLYNIYDPTRETNSNVVIKFRGDQVDSKTTGVDMNSEMKAIL